MEAEAIPERVEEKAADIGTADLVLAILAEFQPAIVGEICDALTTLPESWKIAVLENGRSEVSPVPSTGTPDSNAPTRASVFHLPWPVKPDSTPTGSISMYAAYESVFAAAEKLQARGCCILASKLESFTPQCISQFAQPLLQGQADLVLPHYARRKFEGLLNNCILAPLARTLYGKRVNNPMGPDFGISRGLLQSMAPKVGNASSNRLHPLASLTPAALCQNLTVMEVRLGSRVYPPTDWGNMSSILSDVLSPVFLDMERNAACWQRTRFSTPLPSSGELCAPNQDTGTLDTTRLLESFQLGNRELQEIWGLVLPPSTLVELRKLARLPIDKFEMPDQLWVRIVYDFALAHRLRTISRDHLLRSMTPLYLGWVASYVHDVQHSNAFSVERRLERLAAAYEASKPYLVSRWRWPDRFNP